ncbi:MAG: IS110 family transposase [Rhodobacteraceae bacterium]|nr:IS110 family transposase [Paracoccaceae bacterium]
MENLDIVGIDLAKIVFQLHGCSSTGEVIFRKQLRRSKLLSFISRLPTCTIAMEACSGSHYWGREFEALGHSVRLIPPKYVKPFVKRSKSDAIDAEAICEAALRPTMRFVQIRSEDNQAAALAFRARGLLVRQRTQIINALRGHLSEFGFVVAKGPTHVSKLVSAIEDGNIDLPGASRPLLSIMVDTLETLNARIRQLETQIARRAKEDETSRRLTTIPGIGPIIATAIAALAPPASTFKRGRDFAAWLGLTPLQHSTGGKQRLGRTSKMGNRTLRRLLIIGASAVVRWAEHKGAAPGSWLARMLERKPPMLIRVALANKMARIAWALMAHGDEYRAQVVTR